MKKCWLLFCAILMISVTAQAQSFMFDPLDEHPDSNYISTYASVSDTSWVALTVEETIVNQGAAALGYEWQVQRAESWGGFTKYEIWHPDSFSVWDFSAFENLSLWYYNETPSSDPGRIHLRLQLFDVSDAPVNTYDAGNTELWYSFEYVLDDAAGWTEIVLPLEDVGSAATSGSNGFWRTGWSGVDGNNTLNLNAIKGIGMEISIDAPQDFSVHTGKIIFDALGFSGARALPVIFFNGNVIPGNINNHFAWNGSTEIVPDAGATPGTGALKWTQGAGQPWTGFVFEFDPQFLTFRWGIDSLKFKIKAPTGTSTLRAQFADAAGNIVKKTIDEPGGGYNDQWWDVEIPLRDIVDFEAGSSFDTSAVVKFEFMAEGTGNGHVIYFDDMWTGTPEIDIIPPAAPNPVFAVADNLSNLVTWSDTPNESDETYNVYYSFSPITDINAPGIEVVEKGIAVPENTGSLAHLLFSPLTAQQLDIYYAVTCVDAAGNESEPALMPTVVSNTARAIATIQLDPTVSSSFAADGNLGEWAGVQPISIRPSEGAHIVPNTVVSGDNDLSMDLYLATDDNYLYFAFEMDDDVVDTTAVNSWEKDSPDLFLGLYDWHGPQHQAYQSGATPDFQFRMLPGKVVIASQGDALFLNASGDDYHWQLTPPFGYMAEGRISFTELSAVGGGDIFLPRNGYRIPFDVAINDADAGNGTREGIMTWSPYNNDNSWASPSNWMYTWVGDQMMTSIDEDLTAGVPVEFELKQNYPNPFNPSTTIEYAIAKPGLVTLDVYNTLGQKVAILVNQTQSAGRYTVNFNMPNLPTGIYFYRLQTNQFVDVQKMILLK